MDRLGLLDLGGPELDRPLDLPLLALHREALRPPKEVPGLTVLSRRDGGPRGSVEPLGLLRLGADVAGELDVARDGVDRVLDLSNPKEPGVFRVLRRLLEALPRRPEPAAVEEVRPSVPRILGEGDRGPKVRRLANRVPRARQVLANPLRLPRVGRLGRADEALEQLLVDRWALDQRLPHPLQKLPRRHGFRVRRVARIQEPLRREDRVRPRRPPELIRRPLGHPRSLLGRVEGGLEPPFLEPLAGLDEQFLDPCEIEGRIPTEEGGGQDRKSTRLNSSHTVISYA